MEVPKTLQAADAGRYPRMIVTDLDGTLHHVSVGIPNANLETLELLGAHGVIRVLATGRSLWGVRNFLPAHLPLDYLVFSSGAGIADWKTNELLHTQNFSREETEEGVRVLKEEAVSFMMLLPVPESHRFHFRVVDPVAEDFQRRLTKYRPLASELNADTPMAASQFLVICDREAAQKVEERLFKRFPDFSIVKATSPMDGASIWFEIFTRGVSKASAATIVAQRHGIVSGQCLAVGNDFNDESLLRWAGKGCVVTNSPPCMRSSFVDCGHVGDGALASAVRIWLG